MTWLGYWLFVVALAVFGVIMVVGSLSLAIGLIVQAIRGGRAGAGSMRAAARWLIAAVTYPGLIIGVVAVLAGVAWWWFSGSTHSAASTTPNVAPRVVLDWLPLALLLCGALWVAGMFWSGTTWGTSLRRGVIPLALLCVSVGIWFYAAGIMPWARATMSATAQFGRSTTAQCERNDPRRTGRCQIAEGTKVIIEPAWAFAANQFNLCFTYSGGRIFWRRLGNDLEITALRGSGDVDAVYLPVPTGAYPGGCPTSL